MADTAARWHIVAMVPTANTRTSCSSSYLCISVTALWRWRVATRNRQLAAERLLTPAEVAQLFKVHPLTVTRWANQGLIGSVRTLGGHTTGTRKRRFYAS